MFVLAVGVGVGARRMQRWWPRNKADQQGWGWTEIAVRMLSPDGPDAGTRVGWRCWRVTCWHHLALVVAVGVLQCIVLMGVPGCLGWAGGCWREVYLAPVAHILLRNVETLAIWLWCLLQGVLQMSCNPARDTTIECTNYKLLHCQGA